MLGATVVDEEDIFRVISAHLRYYLRVDPDSLTDEQWAIAYNDLAFCRNEEAKHNK